LLNGIGLSARALLTGDTRYDRVAQIAGTATSLPLIEAFKDGNNLIIAGSTWPEDEHMLQACLPILPDNWKLIIAPHEVHSAHIESIKNLFGETATTYSNYSEDAASKVLIIDNIGMLSSLYRYGEIACIGGGYAR